MRDMTDDAKITLVLVDDDAALREALRFSFEVDGFAVRAFATGDAVEAAELPTVGCLVIDQRLPGEDGLALLERLRRRQVDLPAVLITTNPGSEMRRRARAAGVPVVEKPLLFDELTHTVRNLLAGPLHVAACV